MKLSSEDQAWLREYREILSRDFPGLVQQIILFGSKAKGTAKPDSDIDLVVVIREGDHRVKRKVAMAGHDAAIDAEVAPSFIVYTNAEWGRLASTRAPFWRIVERDGVAVG